MHQFKDFDIKTDSSSFIGQKIKISKLFNTEITVLNYSISPSSKKENTDCLKLQIEKEGVKRIVFTGSKVLTDQIEKVPKDKFPFTTKIIMGDNDRYEFT